MLRTILINANLTGRWIVLAILLAMAAVILGLLWLVFRSVCRRLGVPQRTQRIIGAVSALLVCGAVIETWRDKLDDLEQRCNSEFMQSAQVAGASGLEIKKHVNGWNGYTAGFDHIKPFEDPKVMLWIWFTREAQQHRVRVTCLFGKIPGSGEPPQLRFEKLDVRDDRYP